MKIVNKERIDKLTGKQGNKLTRKQVDKGLRRAAFLRAFSLVTLFTRLLVTFSPCLLFTLTSCDRRELTYYEVSEITLTADWSQSGLDEKEVNYGATAVFYPHGGGEPKVFLLGDRSGDVIRLPEGVYDALLFNRSFNDFSNIAFRGNGGYRTLEAYARKMETRQDGSTRTIASSPDELAVATLEGFTVTEDMLGNYSHTTYGRAGTRPATGTTAEGGPFTICFTPRKLTREVVAVLHVEGLNNVRSVTCRLDGVAESVFLATGEASANTVTQEFTPSDPQFTPGSPFDGTITGTFEVFGFDTQSGHSLHIDALLVDGKTHFTENYDRVKVTETDNGEGTFILRVEVSTSKVPDVKPEGGSGSGFDVDVDGWGDDVKTDIPIE